MGQTGQIFAAMLLPFVMFIGALTAWVITIVALWRGMKAHESLAESLRMIAETQKRA